MQLPVNSDGLQVIKEEPEGRMWTLGIKPLLFRAGSRTPLSLHTRINVSTVFFSR